VGTDTTGLENHSTIELLEAAVKSAQTDLTSPHLKYDARR
jgi:hypothetical protein